MTYKPAPKIDGNTTFLSFDVESNGLHGPGFAVGAVLVKADGTLLDEFSGRAAIRGQVDEWVDKNVLPALKDWDAEKYPSYKALRSAFWQWLQDNQQRADWVLSDNGYPVEHRFLMQCQEDDIENRYWQHPYPLIDVATLLLQVGVKPLTGKAQFVAEDMEGIAVKRHNPRSDAFVSALAAIRALRMSGQLQG